MTTGSTIGDYAVFDEIGRGATAVVRIGVRRGRGGFMLPLAFKQLHPEFEGDARKLAMILDEARVSSRFSHPNVVPVVDVVSEDKSFTLVMPFVRGVSLRKLATKLAGRPCPPAIAVAIACDVLAGLQAAHALRIGDENGVVHRDVAPSNVLVTADGMAQLLDFGIARYKSRLQHTKTDELKGTLAYMAPEQLEGKSDHRVDVYALSVLLWELVTGRSLFGGETRHDMLNDVLSTKVARPSRVSKEVPKALDSIVLRGLERDPNHRWPTAEQMKRALEHAVDRAAPAEVGAWVTELAADELAHHDELVVRAERAAVILATNEAKTAFPRWAFAAIAALGAATLVSFVAAIRAESSATLTHEPRTRSDERPRFGADEVPSASRASSTDAMGVANTSTSTSTRKVRHRTAAGGESKAGNLRTERGDAKSGRCVVRVWVDENGRRHYDETCP